ncbi:MAG: hypothetical protein IH599_00410 [Bacteroidales bacterium]|nr:hypothetical protein [Bacteroidales bacterium]
MEFPLPVFQTRTPGFNKEDSACPLDFFYVNLEALTSGYPLIGWEAPGATIIDTTTLPSLLGLSYNNPGTYPVWVWMQDSCGISCARRMIRIYEPIPPGFIGNRYFCPGQGYGLQATGGSNYIWSTGQTQAQVWFPNMTHTIPISVTMTDTHGCRSSANIVIRKMQPYQDENICMVDVTTGQHLEIIWERTPMADIKAYNVQYSSMQQPDVWNTLASINFENAGRVQDSTHDPSVTQYLYRIQVIDSCNAISKPSPTVGHLHLKASSENGMVMLSWLPYQGLSYNKVYVLRAVYGGDFILLDSVGTPGINFLDVSPPSGAISYKLQIRDTVCSPDPQAILDVINSNIYTVNVIGINESAEYLPVNVFYLQGSGELLVELNDVSSRDLWIEIYSIAGQRIMHYDLAPASSTRLSMYSLAPAMYFYAIGIGSRRVGGGRFIRD